VFRLLHRSNEATVDFKKAFELLDKNDKVGELYQMTWSKLMHGGSSSFHGYTLTDYDDHDDDHAAY